MKNKARILLVGPITNKKANLIGGATISFGQVVQYLEQHEASYDLINTQQYVSGFKKYLNIPFIFLQILYKIPRAQIVFLNSSRGGTQTLAPLLYLLSKLFRKKFAFRPFGGDIKDYTARYAPWQKWLFDHTVLRSDILFLQTRALMDHYAKSGANTAYLPTCRLPANEIQKETVLSYNKRFIFLGHVKQSKGIDQILEAAKQLDNTYTIHIYGAITEERYQYLHAEKEVYKGVLQQTEILPMLKTYDVLVLPTYYEGEGYPGCIIEAFSLGLPAISTDWKSIPELVKHGQNGMLISPKSTTDLVEAIQFFTEENYPAYANHAHHAFQSSFNASVVLKETFDKLKQLVSSQ